MPMPAVYAKQGFERREIMRMTDYERETGVVHEASNFNAGNEDASLQAPARRETPKEVTQALVDDFRAAAASGPWTDSGEGPKVFSVPVPAK